MCTTGNVFTNYSNYQLGGYQYGYNIADLFTNVPGINTVFNYSNYGCSNLGYGYGTGCGGNNNWQLGFGIGSTVLGILGTIGGAWISNARTEKAEAKVQEEKSAESLENAMKTLGFTKKGYTLEEVLAMDPEKILKMGITDPEYDDAALTAAKGKVKTKKESVDIAKSDLKTAETNVDTAEKTRNALKKEWDALTTEKQKDPANATLKQQLADAEQALKDANAAKTKANNALENAKLELKEAEEKKKKIEEKHEKFGEAKRVVREAILKKKEIEDKRKNMPQMGLS